MPEVCPPWLKEQILPHGSEKVTRVDHVYMLWEHGRDGFPPLKYVVEKYTGRNNSWLNKRQSEKQWTRIYRLVADTWTGLSPEDARAKVDELQLELDSYATSPLISSPITHLSRLLAQRKPNAEKISNLKRSIHARAKAKRAVALSHE